MSSELSPAAAASSGAGPVRRRGPRGGRLWLFRFIVVTVVTLVAGELGSRAFWYLRGGVPLTDPGRVLWSIYPGLRKVDKHHPTNTDQTYDVLLLGASTLNPEFGPIELMLQERLTRELKRRVRTFNIAEAGHMSRDSLLKYQAVGADRFDLVVVYDNINETRANNCPPEIFQSDYSHFGWYLTANALAPYHGRARWGLPMTCRFLGTLAQRFLSSDKLVSQGDPRADWLPYGQTVRSADSLQHNLEEIVSIAQSRGETVVLMSFAFHFVDDYTREKFKKRQLDYCLHISPTDIWGPHDQVRHGVEVHNEVITRVAHAHPEVIFVDQQGAIEKSGRLFNDSCHLTSEGCQIFVNNLVQELLRRGILPIPEPESQE
ncbi:MAG: hypothetical protein ACK50P_02615 [Planctomycetaceae bacterium]